MTWSAEGPQGNEAAKIKHLIVPYTRGRVLDLGCGPFKCWPHFIGVDNGHHAREFGWQYKPDIVVEDCTRLDLFRDESVNAVFSSHLLEHIEDYRAALHEWWSLIKPGGHLVLYLPHKDFYPNIGQPGANPDHKHDFEPADIIRAMKEIAPRWDLVLSETRDGGEEYSFLQVYRKGASDESGHTLPTARQKKTALVCRFGGFGDLLMASSVLPGLRRQRYHVTFMTTPKGQDLLRHDPNIDAWWIQDEDQVPNPELPAYWEALATRYDRFVNLSESVEGTLLAVPGRSNHAWPDEVRRERLGTVNYLDFIHELAQVPHGPELRFYPTETERMWAHDFWAELGGEDSFVIVWSLAGSSLHKAYPWTDNVVARLMLECPRVKVVFVGDTACQILELGWEAEPRVVRRSGVWSIRETLAFLEVADLVVGPETGVLNAAAPLSAAKVIMLSHSSHENLTRDWQRTTVLTPEKLPCYPCHRLHYGDRYCHVEPESHAALCAFGIDPDRVFEAINYYQETP